MQNDLTERIANGLGWFSVGLGLAEIMAPGSVARFIGVSDDDGNRSLLRFYGFRELAAGVGILSQQQPTQWLWGRVGGDLLDIASLGRAMTNDSNEKGKLTFATAAVLGVTALDVICAKQMSEGQGNGIASTSPRQFTKSITVNCTPEQAYQYWHNFQNFPSFMSNLESVEMTGGNRSHWRAKGPAGTTVEWDAETIDDQPNSAISWRSTENADISNSGSVRFERGPGGRGTIIHVEMSYQPPAGSIGTSIAKLLGKEPEQQISQDLRHFKQILETGEIVHSDSSIHPGMHPAQPPASAPVENMPQHSTEPLVQQRTSTSEPNWAPMRQNEPVLTH